MREKKWQPKIPEIQYEEEPLDLSYMETDTEYDPITYSSVLGDGANLTYGNIPEEVKEANANGTVYTPDPEPEVPTYEQWLAGIKEEAIRKAKAERERAITDAEYSYARYLNPYGAHAEAMSNAGLGNTGYSDYLKGNAYTTMREEIGKANAAYADAERNADLSYAENLYKLQESDKLKTETKQAQDIPSYITNAQNGQYTSEQIEQIITDNGYTGADADALRGALKQYEQGQNLNIADISSKISNGEFGSWSALESYAKAANLDPEQFKVGYANKIADEIKLNGLNNVSVLMVDDLKKLDQKLYDKLVKSYNDEQDTSENGFKDASGEFVSKEIATQALKAIENDNYLTEETKKKYKETYNKHYCAEVIQNSKLDGLTFVINDKVISKSILRGDSKAIDDDTVIEAAKNVPGGTVFRFNGKIYFKAYSDDIIYESPVGVSNEHFDNNNTEFIN